MKAIEILKNGIVFMETHKDLNPHTKEHLESEIAQYKEAIAELEAIQEYQACSTCQHKEHSPMFNNCNHKEAGDGWNCKTFYENINDYYIKREA